MQDPREATRERIERLKKEGAVELEEPSSDKGAIPPAKVPVLKQGRAAASEVSGPFPMRASSTKTDRAEGFWPLAASSCNAQRSSGKWGMATACLMSLTHGALCVWGDTLQTSSSQHICSSRAG